MKTLKLSIILTAIFVVFSFLLVGEIRAGTGHNVWGWAWSSNIGWISFNNTSGGGTTNYGVNINSDGILSGYAWSENIGWLTFNESELSGCPSTPCRAWLDSDNKAHGWAKALTDGGGWPGWIRLRDTNYGVWIDTIGSVDTIGFVQNPTKLTIIYKAPKYGLTGLALSSQDVVDKFQNVIYARNQMSDNLSGYLNAGFVGKAMIYLCMDEFAGPAGLASVTAQKTLCTSAQKQFKGYSNNPAMDTGDFCEIHDGIINQTALPDYPDIIPTEGWFLHKADGSRFIRAGGADSLYRPNPNNPGWREYYARRALREMIGGQEVNYQGVITSHPAVAGVTGLFIDNVDLSWSKVLSENGGQPPKEYISNADYVNAVLGFLQNVQAKLPNIRLR